MRFNVNPCCYSNVIAYGKPLLLSLDLDHIIYDNKKLEIQLNSISTKNGLYQSALTSRQGPVNAFIRVFVYDVEESENQMIVIQKRNINTYFDKGFEFGFVKFNGRIYEPVS